MIHRDGGAAVGVPPAEARRFKTEPKYGKRVKMTATPTFIIDSDSHVVEPRDLWSSRMSKKKWGDLIPEVRSVKGEGEFWFVRGQRLWDVNGAGVMVSDADGKPVRNADYPQFVNTFDEMHPAEYDAKERVKVLDEYGIYAAT